MAEQDVSLLSRFAWIANIIFHQAVAVCIVFILHTVIVNFNLNSFMAWHIALNSIGYVFLMMEAIILLTKTNVYTINISRTKKMPLHGLLMGASTICITVGISLNIAKLDVEEHFITTHGKLGLAAFVLLWVAVIFGIICDNAKIIRKYVSPVWMKLIHVVLGCAAFAVGIACLCIGMDYDFFKVLSTENTILAVTIVISILSVWSGLAPLISVYNYLKNIFNVE